MKHTSTKLIAGILLLVALSSPRTQAAATVYADNIASTTTLATQVTADATNVPAVEAGQATNISPGRHTVRIDKTGVHIGGSNPVDIGVPTFATHRGERAVDLVGLVAVVFGCTIPIAIVAIVFYFRHRRLRMHHETIRAMIEKGQPIPPEMAAGLRSQTLIVDNWTVPEGSAQLTSARRDFRSGLILTAVGAALLMIVGKVGWILVFIGAARLIFWLVEDRSPKV
jgi:hypothetical protein